MHAIADVLLAEFERELPTTRRFLERVPATSEALLWRPHERSMTTGQLAHHIAALSEGVLRLAQVDEAAPPDFSTRHQPRSLDEVLATFDESAAFVRATLPTIDDARMNGPWRLVQGGHELMTMPRATFLRSVLLNHCYHHRGQLGVYLRLLGAKVPSSYGPSGDE
ncbi:MAG: DinB family protein [Phycisphaerales bacterium]|nr:DinB family protein [Phycisphaerales bacterium]